MKSHQSHFGLAILLIIAFLAHSAIALFPPLNGDEATFWEWSRHLAFGYYAHPPMTAFLVAASTSIFSSFAYAVRLPAILLHLGTIVFCYLLGAEVLNNKKLALGAAILFALLPISLVIGTAMTTDANLVFCFTAAVYFTRKALIEEKKGHWYTAAIACGGMLLTKFMAFFFFPGLFFFLLFNKPYRKWFVAKEPYLASAIALAIFSPFLYWNYQNHWLTFQFNFYTRHREEGFDLIKPIKYIGGQMLAASPLIFVLIVIALLFFLIKIYRKQKLVTVQPKEKDSLLLLTYFVAFPLLYFAGNSLTVEVAPHWPAMIYAPALVLLLAWINQLLLKNGKDLYSSKLYGSGAVSAFLISASLGFLVLFPKTLPDHLLYTAKVNDDAPVLSHYFGWHEIGQHIDTLKDEWEGKEKGLFLTSKDYSLASMLGFYTPSHPNFYLMNVTEDVVHGKSYLLWEKGKKPLGANTLYVSDTPNSYKSRLLDFFKEIKHLEPFIVRDDNGRILRIFYLTIGLDYLGGEPDNLSLWTTS